MITFKKRIGIYLAMWLLIALAFAFAPFAPSEYPEHQERVLAFLEAPLMVAAGFTALFPWHGAMRAGIFTAAILYLVVHAIFTLTCVQRRPFIALCVVHLFLSALAVVGSVHYSWHDQGG